MFRLRIERVTENFFDKNVATVSGRDDPDQNAERDRNRPKARSAYVVESGIDATIS